MAKNIVSDVVNRSPNRRSLLRTLGIAGAAASAAFVGDGKAQAQSGLPSVVDVLQFALNLEYLEAEFYTVATTGQTISQMGIGIDGSGTAGDTYGGNQVNFSNNLVFTGQIASEIGADERAHVSLIRNALQTAGVRPIAKPAINLGALGIGFGNMLQFLTVARALEDIGVSAYAYAAGVPTVANSPYIGTAAQILAAEAEHVGNIRLQVARLNVASTALDKVDVVPPPAGQRFISVDANGLSAARTPGQVLFLAYGSVANASAGGFYPTGVNGAITMSSAGA